MRPASRKRSIVSFTSPIETFATFAISSDGINASLFNKSNTTRSKDFTSAFANVINSDSLTSTSSAFSVSKSRNLTTSYLAASTPYFVNNCKFASGLTLLYFMYCESSIPRRDNTYLRNPSTPNAFSIAVSLGIQSTDLTRCNFKLIGNPKSCAIVLNTYSMQR